MTRQQLRVFLDKFYCGCASPDGASGALMDVLLYFESPMPRVKDMPAEWFPDIGFRSLFLYFIDSLGLIEHGSNITCSWLTEKGKEVLTALRVEQLDDFKSLHGEYCCHGYDLEDIGDGKHDCSTVDAQGEDT